MSTSVKYTKEQENELVDGYKAYALDDHDGREDFILIYMNKHSKSKRSVTAKLSKMGYYISRPRTSKVTGEKPETKEQMLQKVANKLGVDILKLEGIDKSPKLSLQNLLNIITERLETKSKVGVDNDSN